MLSIKVSKNGGSGVLPSRTNQAIIHQVFLESPIGNMNKIVAFDEGDRWIVASFGGVEYFKCLDHFGSIGGGLLLWWHQCCWCNCLLLPLILVDDDKYVVGHMNHHLFSSRIGWNQIRLMLGCWQHGYLHCQMKTTSLDGGGVTLMCQYLRRTTIVYCSSPSFLTTKYNWMQYVSSICN